MRFDGRFSCSMISGILMIVCLIGTSEVYATLATHAPSEIVQDITVQVKRAEKTINDTQTAIVDTIEAQTNGFKELANDYVSGISSSVSEQIQSAKNYLDGQIQAGGDYIKDQATSAGDYISDSVGGDEVGDGFLLSQNLGCLKESLSKYNKYITPVKDLVTGDFPDAVSDVRGIFYTKTSDKLSTYSVSNVQSNLKKFIQEATKTAIGDATQVMNGTSQYKKIEETANDSGSGSFASCKPTDIREDINKSNTTALTMNIMANTLLSMDITELSIQSATIYDNINTVSVKSLLIGK